MKVVCYRGRFVPVFICWHIVSMLFAAYAQAEGHQALLSPFVTVITAEDIRAMGATDVDEVLETVPGLHVAIMFAGNPVYTFRGVYTFFNSQARLLINGIEIMNEMENNRTTQWAGMPVEAIERIEVIRGPNPTAYNLSSFAGIINIVTKTYADIKQPEAGIRYGSFETLDGWALTSGVWNGFEVAVALEYRDTEGHKRIIEEDDQTHLDRIYGTNASLAPGPVSLQREAYDMRLDIAQGLWRLRSGIQLRKDLGYYVGTGALDPKLTNENNRWTVDLTYHNPELTRDWELEAQLSYLDMEWTIPDPDRDKRIFPPGTDLGEGVYPEGVRLNGQIWENRSRLTISAWYTGIAKHRIRLRAGAVYADIYRVQEKVNYGINPATGEPLLPGSPMVDVSDTPYSVMVEKDRKFYSLSIEDNWQITKVWGLTAGVAYEDYSDTRENFNHYLALLWKIQNTLTARLSYSQTFRPPSIGELWLRNNPEHLGNPNLDSEKMESEELAFSYQPTDALHLGLNLFRYTWSDAIDFAPLDNPLAATAQNLGEQTGYGIELDMDWQLNTKLRLKGNYALLQSTDETHDAEAGNAPNHQIYLRGEWQFLPHWHFTPQINWVMDRKRRFDDSRSPIEDYIKVDLTLRHRYLKNWEFALAARNLFDDDVREPSGGAGRTGTRAPHDFPMMGRSLFGEIRYQF